MLRSCHWSAASPHHQHQGLAGDHGRPAEPSNGAWDTCQKVQEEKITIMNLESGFYSQRVGQPRVRQHSFPEMSPSIRGDQENPGLPGTRLSFLRSAMGLLSPPPVSVPQPVPAPLLGSVFRGRSGPEEDSELCCDPGKTIKVPCLSAFQMLV